MKTNINLNETVEFKLTEYGKNVIKDWFKDNKIPHDNLENYVETLTKLPLWEFMNYFGKVLYMGNPNIPTVNNSIVIDLKE